MNKLYWVKLHSKRLEGMLINRGHNTGLSHAQAVDLIISKGINRVEKIMHDDKTPRNTKQIDGKEMLGFWKAVAAKKPN